MTYRKFPFWVRCHTRCFTTPLGDVISLFDIQFSSVYADSTIVLPAVDNDNSTTSYHSGSQPGQVWSISDRNTAPRVGRSKSCMQVVVTVRRSGYPPNMSNIWASHLTHASYRRTRKQYLSRGLLPPPRENSVKRADRRTWLNHRRLRIQARTVRLSSVIFLKILSCKKRSKFFPIRCRHKMEQYSRCNQNNRVLWLI